MEESISFAFWIRTTLYHQRLFSLTWSNCPFIVRDQQIPYEILPTSNSIVSLLAGSGFPADRFAIEYFPRSMREALEKRKPMKMTVGIVQFKKDLLNTIDAIRNIYGG